MAADAHVGVEGAGHLAPRRVVLVDDDEISRRGMETILRSHTTIEVVAGVDHDEALSTMSTWPAIDVLVLDAADPRRDDDHFIGVEVARRFRELPVQESAVVIVVTGHFLSDALRRRMREAGADYYVHRSELQTESAFIRALDEPGLLLAGVPDARDPEAMFRVGVGPSSKVNDAVAHELAQRSASEPPADAGIRTQLRARQRFQAIARLLVVNADGRPPEREQSAPSRPQIERFLDWATRADDR